MAEKEQDSGRPALLVIDDLPGVGISIRVMLAGMFEVIACASGEEALASVRSGGRIDAVLSDIQLGDQSFGSLARALVALRPELAGHLLLMTGGAFPSDDAATASVPPSLRLLKPFRTEQLIRALATIGVSPGAP